LPHPPNEFFGKEAGENFRGGPSYMSIIDPDGWIVELRIFAGVVEGDDLRGRGRLPET